MKFEITLEIPMKSEKICKSIVDALTPDNYTAPRGISIDMKCNGGNLAVNVRAESVGVLTVRNTVDDILAHINIALKSISTID
jgi:tRNA threonylcarbamoyladenosine modification (KEOPS) complex  Pcc1 subunit